MTTFSLVHDNGVVEALFEEPKNSPVSNLLKINEKNVILERDEILKLFYLVSSTLTNWAMGRELEIKDPANKYGKEYFDSLDSFAFHIGELLRGSKENKQISVIVSP